MRKPRSKKEEVLRMINGEMNIVLTLDTPSGPVHFADNYYASKTPEELEAIKREFYEVCWRVVNNNHERISKVDKEEISE